MKQIFTITKKELRIYFSSFLSILFLGTFLFSLLFIFFNIETFFSRGIADVRPMFKWLPVLLIFLISALTMRQWSEEQRSNTMEILLTLPVTNFQLVLGKFFAVMGIMLIALAMTLPLPMLVSLFGNLDWGPVIGGYIAAILMSAAYAAIGLFVSSRTDNQIVALISTILIGGIFYLVGTSSVLNLISGPLAEILRALGTGSRFQSIERGVIDLRDMVYYLSLAGIFLLLNTISMDSIRWNRKQKAYRNKSLFTGSLIAINLVLMNIWLFPLNTLRMDLTQQKEFTISQVTKDLMTNLEEPLLIRAYLSEKTHPLLAPLAPQIEDMLREYAITSNGKARIEIVDPIMDPDIETEANQTYGIRPTPFQVSGRNESSIINAYFNILVRYGDQSIVLSLDDLIEVEQYSTGVQVKLDNLEYDLTSAIKKVVSGFQSVESVLAALEEPAELTFYLSMNTVPVDLYETAGLVQQIGEELAANSNGKLVFNLVDPDQADFQMSRESLMEEYEIRPYQVSLFSSETYFFHLILKSGEEPQLLYPPYEANEADIRAMIESALKRTTSGFLKVVGVWSPPQTPTQDIYGQTQQPLSSYYYAQEQLSQEYQVKQVDLSTGQVPSDVDVLMVIAPQDLSGLEAFAIDQFLMKGGSVIIAASPYQLDVDPYSGALISQPVENSVQDLLANYGVQLMDGYVMDLQNAPFPMMVQRDLNGFAVQEIQAVDYPYFIDVRQNGMDQENYIVSNLPLVSMNWASPVVIDEETSGSFKTSTLMQSSQNSWIGDATSIEPDYMLYPDFGFAVSDTQQSYPLAVALQGSFKSFFMGRPVPVEAGTDSEAASETVGPVVQDLDGKTVIEQSPDSTRLIVIGSTGFMDDFALRLSSNLTDDYYLNNLAFIQNIVDWTQQDQDLLMIRSRGTATRVLVPLSEKQQNMWEVVCYISTIALLLIVFVNKQISQKREGPMELSPIEDQRSSSQFNGNYIGE
jgi:ABC-2 type transport system permease protein